MHQKFEIQPLWTLSRRLSLVAGGMEPPDIIIRGVRPVSVFTEEILPESEVWLAGGRIAALKPAGSARWGGVEIFDGDGALLGPGLVDPHLHIESSMMTACAYAEAALKNGTTTIFCDSHEIANVCGVHGVEWMLEDARRAALNIFLTVPSTVPATTDEFETAGGNLTPEAIGEIFDSWPEAVALGEKMDFVAVAAADARSHAIIAESLRRGNPVSGHVYGLDFVAPYAAAGVTDTHEATTGEIARDLLRAGVWIFLRGGNPLTPWHSLPEAIQAITVYGCSPKRVCLCTDDRDADDLFLFGMDWVVREARKAGLSPALAWSMGSLHPASRFGMDSELGSLGAGRRADLVLMDDEGTVRSTWLGGKLVVRNGECTPELVEALESPYVYPGAAYNSVSLPATLSLLPELPSKPVQANVIELVASGIETRHSVLNLDPTRGWPALLSEHDLCHVAVIERHGLNGNVAHGLLKNFGLTDGAVASTVGHDAHNLIVAGTEARQMALAVETLRNSNGGVCVVRGNRVTAHLPLPVAGLLSDHRATTVATMSADLKMEWAAAGCRIPYMGFNLIPLSVIPEIRITDKGLLLVNEMRQLPIFF